MKKAILTGATGAIGMALINELISKNVEMLVICRKDSDRNDRIPKHELIKIVYASLDEYDSIVNVEDESYDVFYHFAWSGTTGESRNDMYLQNENVKHALDAVKLAARFHCKLFVAAGSQAEYGLCDGILKTDTPVNPVMGYGIAKLCAGQMTKILCEQLGLKHSWVRVLSVYGPYDTEKSMVSSCIMSLLANERPQFTKAEQKWDYIYSKDAADAFFLIGEKMADGVYVLGSGEVRPLREYIECIRDSIDTTLVLGIGEVPYGAKQIMHLQADISKLKDIGFEPKISFEEGIIETINWSKQK